MKQTNSHFELNVKTITLDQVFKLNLQNFPELVGEICMEASNEAKNEIEISNIEVTWKSAQFTLK